MTDRFFSEKYGIILYCSLSYLFSFGAIFSSNSYVRAPDTAMIPATAMIPICWPRQHADVRLSLSDKKITLLWLIVKWLFCISGITKSNMQNLRQ